MQSLVGIRKDPGGILALGAHIPIVQSILDLDYLCGRRPSLVGIIGKNRSTLKFFFGPHEMLLPVWGTLEDVPSEAGRRITWMLNVQSGRRAHASTTAFFDAFPHAHGGHIFAENIPEAHAQDLVRRYVGEKLIAGPSGVGFLVPGFLKLGAIGGTDLAQIFAGKLSTPGSVAVVSTSGGMTNELIRAVIAAGKRVSFALSIGGDRFPVTSLTEVLLLAEHDLQTKATCYFGELGGEDEYEIVALLKTGKLSKPIHCYIAGIIDEVFEDRMQFGHAKALVQRPDESARAKRKALAEAGAVVGETFSGFLAGLSRLPQELFSDTVPRMDPLAQRRPSILSTREIVDAERTPRYVTGKKLAAARPFAFASSALQALLGREISKETSALAENMFELLLDHGGEVSGAVNAMITARAGKDLSSSLAAGLLTIGPRFGGAVNDAAAQWIDMTTRAADAETFVEEKTGAGKLLAGIGHRKYRVGVPDPRVLALSEFAQLLKKHPHYDCARAVEKVTTGKNGKLILNVDGVIAALMLDMLSEKDGLTEAELRELVKQEFFNALFVIPRTVGFIAHIMEQKKNDEGLFRLPSELLFVQKARKNEKKRA